MKKILPYLIALLIANTAQSQSAICQQFLQQKNIQTFCVDNYPLGDDDSINVTFLMADDSDAYNTMIKIIHKLPNQKNKLYFTKKNQKIDSTKYFIIHLFNALPNDKGRYLIFFSPYNLSAMVFHIRNDKDMEKVVAHVLRRETIKD